MILVDTSALLALLDPDDEYHERAAASFDDLMGSGSPLTHNYVVLESTALIHRRAGAVATRRFLDDFTPLLRIVWVDEDLHRRAVGRWLAELRRGSSLVDHVSFEVMRDRGMDRAFAFDRGFARAGFALVP